MLYAQYILHIEKIRTNNTNVDGLNVNSHPIRASYMALFSNAFSNFVVCNRSWGWPSGIDHILSLARFCFRARFDHRDFSVIFLVTRN